MKEINNNILDTTCSIEVSILLKRKGCDVPAPYWDLEDIGELYVRKLTHDLAKEWIRVNFGIWIFVDIEPKSGVYYPNIDIKAGQDYYDILDSYNTPQEATEAALLFTLQHLLQ